MTTSVWEDRKWLKTSPGPPIVKNKAAYCLLFPLQKWPKADFVLSSVIYHFPEKTGSASLCLLIPEILALCSFTMVCALRSALRDTECPRGRLPLASPVLADQHGVSLRVWNISQLVPVSSWQIPSRLSVLLTFCNHLLVRFCAATSRHAFLVSASKPALGYELSQLR